MKGIIFFAQLEAVLHTLILRRKMSWQWFDNLACQPSSTPYQQQIQNGQTYLYASVLSLMVQIIQKLILTECHGLKDVDLYHLILLLVPDFSIIVCRSFLNIYFIVHILHLENWNITFTGFNFNTEVVNIFMA